MISAEITVENDHGLHSRPADLFVRTARLYRSAITVHKGAASADAKQILRVLLLNVSPGTVITIEADGPDEQAALEDLRTLVTSNFQIINEAVRSSGL